MTDREKVAQPIDWSIAPEPVKKPRLGGRKRRLLLAMGAALAAVAVGLTLFFILDTSTFFIPSVANTPTLDPGDHVLMIKGSSVSRNELIVFHSPAAGGRLVIMRAVAIGGDRISQVGDNLYVDGKVAPRPFLPTDTTYPVPNLVIPAGSVYVLGDNRADSFDSRGYGPVPKSDVVGHLVLCYWPIGRVGGL